MSASGKAMILISQDCACWPASLCTNAPQFPGAVGETGHGRRGPSPAVPLRLLKGTALCPTVPYSETGILGRFALVFLAAACTTDGAVGATSTTMEPTAAVAAFEGRRGVKTATTEGWSGAITSRLATLPPYEGLFL